MRSIWFLTIIFALAAHIPGKCADDRGAAFSSERVQWEKFRMLNVLRQPAAPARTAPVPAGSQLKEQGPAGSYGQAGIAPDGYFAIPAYFSRQPPAYTRPAETFSRESFSPEGKEAAALGLSLGLAATPFAWGYGSYPYGPGRGWLYGYGPLPYAPGYALPGYLAPRWGFSGHGFAGLGYGAALATPFSWGGPFVFSGTGFGALSPIVPGLGFSGSRTGQFTGRTVNQSAPGKASGNYYAPSTVDSSASGSYYATQSPAMTPIIQQKQPPSSYWGPSHLSPFGKDLNSVPWTK